MEIENGLGSANKAKRDKSSDDVRDKKTTKVKNPDMDKKLRDIWIKFHKMAIKYDPKNSNSIEKMKEQIMDQLDKLPCNKCRVHALEYAAENPITANTSYDLQQWFFTFHNYVSSVQKQKQGYDENPVLTPHQYTIRYWEELEKKYNMPMSKELYSETYVPVSKVSVHGLQISPSRSNNLIMSDDSV